MAPEDIRRLRVSFEKVRPISDRAAEMFYARLFEIAPESRALFRSDMKMQGRKLMATLASVINGIDEMHLMEPAVRNLGRRHAGYGVAAEHFAPVNSALLWTLEQTLGDDFTPEVKGAWEQAYEVLADIMIRAETPGAKA